MTRLIEPNRALPGRPHRTFKIAERHKILNTPVVTARFPGDHEVAIFGLGCFWGAEEIYWQIPGVWSTSVGYAGGYTPHPTYQEVVTGRTGHTESVRIVVDPDLVSYADLVKKFFEIHDPTQGLRHGNDIGTEYRSAIYYTTRAHERIARDLTQLYAEEMAPRHLGDVTTEIKPAYAFVSE